MIWLGKVWEIVVLRGFSWLSGLEGYEGKGYVGGVGGGLKEGLGLGWEWNV